MIIVGEKLQIIAIAGSWLYVTAAYSHSQLLSSHETNQQMILIIILYSGSVM